MRSLRCGSILAFLVLSTTLPAAAQVNPKNMNPAAPGPAQPGRFDAVPRAVSPELYRLWERLPGRYESTVGRPPVRVSLRAISPFVLFVEASTSFGGKESLERGYIELGDASPSYVSSKKRFSLSYRPEALGMNFTCTFYGAPHDGAVTFETEGSDCSFPLRRPVSKWKIDTSRDEISVTDAKTGESTVLRRVSRRRRSGDGETARSASRRASPEARRGV